MFPYWTQQYDSYESKGYLSLERSRSALPPAAIIMSGITKYMRLNEIPLVAFFVKIWSGSTSSTRSNGFYG